jgi:hypothetical protein
VWDSDHANSESTLQMKKAKKNKKKNKKKKNKQDPPTPNTSTKPHLLVVVFYIRI